MKPYNLLRWTAGLGGLLLLSCVGGAGCAQGNFTRERTRAMQVFVADSLTKVWREPEAGETPLKQGEAELAAARNERESVQVVAEAGDRALRGVNVAVSELRQEGGAGVIPADHISVNPVGYVETHRPAYPVDRVGWWPDPLLPPGPVDVEAGRRQPFWITVYVPKTAPAGRYAGVITVSAEGLPDQTVPLELTVWDFALGDTPPLPSAVAIYEEELARFYGWSEVPESVLRNYWDMLFTHRLSSDDLGTPIPGGMDAVLDGKVSPPFDYRTFDERLEYCLPRGLTAFQAARLPGFLSDGPDLTEEQQARAVAYLRDLSNHLEERGWLDKAFAMVWDEPRDECAPQVLKELQVIHRANPRLRSRLDGPVTGPLVDLCEDEVDIWGMHILNLARGGEKAKANMDRWRREGRVLWMYVACDVHHPYPNIFIDYPLMDCRVLPWLFWKYDIQGFLYWSANYWGKENLKGNSPQDKWPHRPWVAANFTNEWEGKRNEFNGDGQLIYPGPDGAALSSIRLEALRDGMEDYEYVWLLEKGLRKLEKSGSDQELAAEARRWLENQPVVRSFTDWCHDPGALLNARRDLADLIVRVTRAAGG